MRKGLIFLASAFIIFLIILVLRGVNPLELKLKAGLQVTTNNVAASLFLDDQYLDKSPFIDKKIQPKSYTLRIQPDEPGFASYDLPITLNKGVVTVVTWKPGQTLETSGGVVYEMARLRNRSDIQVEFQTVPDGAIVTFDNGTKQFSPLLMTDLSEDNHQFEVSLPSYETQQHAVKLIKGHKVTITVFLGKITGELLPVVEATTAANPLTTETVTEPQVQILSTNFFVNNQEVLRVRTTPSPVGEELGFAPVGELYPLLSESTDWFQIQFQDQPGWVSVQYSQKITPSSAQTGE